MYKSHQEMATNLTMFLKAAIYVVLILESNSKRLLTQLLSYPDVNTSWKLSVVSCDKKLNQQDTCRFFIVVCEYQLWIFRIPMIISFPCFVSVSPYTPSLSS
jgi:hypothetical protein